MHSIAQIEKGPIEYRVVGQGPATLIIASKYDGSIDASHASYAADHIPNAELFVSPAESHLLWFSSYNAAIEEEMHAFLQTSRA
jgi:pimeloyl-ACP methyl ester carboxylesterase